MQVHDWIASMGVENIGKRLVNSREGKVEFDKPSMELPVLMKYGEWRRRYAAGGTAAGGPCRAGAVVLSSGLLGMTACGANGLESCQASQKLFPRAHLFCLPQPANMAGLGGCLLPCTTRHAGPFR